MLSSEARATTLCGRGVGVASRTVEVRDGLALKDLSRVDDRERRVCPFTACNVDVEEVIDDCLSKRSVVRSASSIDTSESVLCPCGRWRVTTKLVSGRSFQLVLMSSVNKLKQPFNDPIANYEHEPTLES